MNLYFRLKTALLLLAVFAAALHAQSECGRVLQEAENKYLGGRFDEAMALVQRCLEIGSRTPQESESAYSLLGKACYARGLHESAKENLRKLLELVPSWRPDPERDKPSFRQFAEEIIAEVERERDQQRRLLEQERLARETATQRDSSQTRGAQVKKSGGKKWPFLVALIVGGGAAGTLVALNGKEEKTNTRLPDPPIVPTRK